MSPLVVGEVEKIFKGSFQPRPLCDSTQHCLTNFAGGVRVSTQEKRENLYLQADAQGLFTTYLARGQIFRNARMKL